MATFLFRKPKAHLLAAGAAVAFAVLAGTAQRTQTADELITAKLTSILQDLARSVPQSTGAAPQAAAAPLDLKTMPQSVQDAVRGRMLRLSGASDVQIVVLMSAVTPDRLQQLADAGATIEIADAAPDRVQAHAPAARLLAVASLDFVSFVRLPVYARYRAGAVTTEGDAIIRADAARGQLSLDGTGVRVGVISDGMKGVFATGCTTCGSASGGPMGTGDLPTASGTRSSTGVLTQSTGGIAGRSFQANGDLEGLPTGPCAFLGAGAEGTALMEIVHDVAPGAKLAFANADTDLAFNQAVNFLASTNDVVVDDLGFLGLPYDGTSSVSANTASALNNGANPIRGYMTAVGNDSTDHYLGTYVDSGISGLTINGIVTSGHLHLFQSNADTTDVLGLGSRPYDVIYLPQNGEVAIFLNWDDKYGASANNYDLYLVNQSTGKVAAQSTDNQAGSQDPVEVIDYVNTGASGYFQIAVQNVNDRAAAKQLNIFAFEPECAADGPRPLVAGRHERHNYNTPGRSVGAEGDAGGSPVSVISVGAICSGSSAAQALFSAGTPDESCTDRTYGTAEFFSSRGPTIDGRMKPDVAAIDGVAVTAAGNFDNPFFGSSAAAPHVAGEAALLLQAAPCLLGGGAGALAAVNARTSLRNLITQNTMGAADRPPDNTFGYGLVDALAAANKTLPAFHGSAAVTISGNTPTGANVTAEALGFTDPDGCDLTRVSWTGGCGASPGSALSCPFGTTTVSVSASNNGAAFSTPATVAVTVTDFNLSGAPDSATVHAGQSATYTATLTAKGGSFGDPVTLACANLPAGAACSFNPPTVTPGSSASQVTVTVSTSGASTSATWPMALAFICVAAGLIGVIRNSAFGMRPGRSLIAALSIGALSCSGSTSPPPSTTTGGVTLSPASLTFGTTSVGQTSAQQSVTFANPGVDAVQITSLTTSGDFAQTNACGSSLPGAASCAIQVTFTPTQAGARTGTLTITDSAAGSPHTVVLTGTGDRAVTPPGSYSMTITGTAGTLVRTAPVTLVVQ